MIDLSSFPLSINVTIFLFSAIIVAWAGSKLAELGDRLADRTGLGEAITGTVFLGLITALPGLTASVTAALEGRPALAISNAIGGIAIQTTFLAAADIFHTRANLEHAAASLTNLIQTVILILLLSIVMIGLSGPEITIINTHPVTILLLMAAMAGFWLVYKSSTKPMWKPRITTETVEDLPEQENIKRNLGNLISGFAVHAVIVTAAGAVVAHTSGNIADSTGMSETVAGGFLSGVATSLPELVTTIAAVRRGALTLSISDIVGGNFFDVLFVFAADLIYLKGSIYHAAGVGYREIFLTGLAITLNTTLLLGLLYRQRAGPANIGFESASMLVLYIAGFLILSLYM